jgi:6-phospho-beta-glucosidase
MKLAVIGGGSTYTPELVDGIARLAGGAAGTPAGRAAAALAHDVKVGELALVDPDESRLAVVGPFCDRIMRAYGHPGRVTWTTSLDDGLDGAGAVLLQLRVGGQAARQRDETWPLEYGCIGQETTGAGGLAKALRTVPVVLEIAQRARERAAADAWIIDFTNPVGIVTRALLDAGHRAIGLCNVAIGFQREFAGLLGVAPEQVQLDHVGLNHLTWERAALVNGIDALPGLMTAHGEQVAGHTGLPRAVMQEIGAVPSYYLRYFYAHDAVVEQERGRRTRAEQVAQMERELLAMYADPALDRKPELLGQRGGAFYSEAAVALLASLVSDAQDTQVVNVRNAGTLPFLADEAVIEVPATIGAGGAAPLPVAPVRPLMSGLIAHVSAYEELAVDAARRGGRDRVAAALLAHPLVGQFDLAGQLADRLIAENGAYLAWAGGR